ncbi:MAG: FAD-binding protein [Actinobacteria bacterium]|nr:FAD-binding protein [Actinomycetota bacterium]
MAQYDLVVVGCGAAGLATAVSFLETSSAAGESGRVAVIECAPESERGGASRWTMATLRLTADERLDPTWVGTVQELSRGLADLEYCQVFEREVPDTVAFLKDHGIEVIHHLEEHAALDFNTGNGGPPNLANPNGGGRAIVDTLAARVEEFDGAAILYETEAVRLSISDEGVVDGVVVRGGDGAMRTLRSSSVMLACGGFEGDAEMLTKYLGPDACDLKLIAPGVAYNRGAGLRMATEIGAGTAGQFDMIHAEAVDSRTDRPDAVIYGHPFGIVVNEDANRFFDEGDAPLDAGFERIAFEIWRNQNQSAFFITDQEFMDLPISHWYDTDKDAIKADTIEQLAEALDLDGERLLHTVTEFNAACGEGELDISRRDGKHTVGIVPPKSNWAKPIDSGPYYAYPLTTAITFTYGGLKVDAAARVLTPNGVAIPNLFAAGEITGLFYHEYPSATSVLRSLTFGRIAGRDIARAGSSELVGSQA